MNRWLAIGLMLAVTSVAVALERSAYLPATVSEAASGMEIDPKAAYYFDATHPRFQLVATFAGERRPIGTDRMRYLEMWVKSFRHPDSYLQLFQSEVRIHQDGKSYWMPIQESLVGAFDDEVRSGAQVELFVTRIGAWKQDVVFLVNAFHAK